MGRPDPIRRGDTVRIPFPQAARSVVDERDLAEVSVQALLDPDLVGAAITVTGPKTLTQLAQVDAIGAAPESLSAHPAADPLQD
jgi:uncharacterized protein YbjT (DUF2867 family)